MPEKIRLTMKLSRSSRGSCGRILALALLLGPVSASTVLPVTAFAQPSKADEAKDRFLKGVELYKEGDFPSALVEFKRSYELNPNFNVLNNIGQVYFQLKDYANALKTLQQYLTEGGTRVTASKRAEAEKDIDTLKGRVAIVTLSVNTPGAEVFVDDVSIGTSPFKEPVLVSAGRRRFLATKEGFSPARETPELAGGDRSPVTLTLAPLLPGQAQPQVQPTPTPTPTPTPAYPQPQPQPQPSGPSFVGPAIAFSATGAFAIVWGAMGGLALSADSNLTTLKQKLTTADALTSQANKAKLYSGVADGFMAATIVGAGVGTALIIVAATGKKSTSAPPAHVGLSVGLGNVGVSGAF